MDSALNLLCGAPHNRFVVRMTVALSARSAMTWKRNSAPRSAIGT
jgi:hypothetical protein